MGLLSAFMGGALGQGLVDTAARMGRREAAAASANATSNANPPPGAPGPAWDENLGDQTLRERLGGLIRLPGQGGGGAGDGSGRAGRIGVDEQPVSDAVRVLADGLVRRGQAGPQAAPDPHDPRGPRDPSGNTTATVPGPPDEARFRASIKAYGAALLGGGQDPGQNPGQGSGQSAAPARAGNAGGASFALRTAPNTTPPIAAHIDRARADARQLLSETRDPARMKAIRDVFSAYSGQAY